MEKKKKTKTPNLDKEKERIGFSAEGTPTPETDEELSRLVQGAKVLEILEKFRIGQATWQDVKELALELTNDETRFSMSPRSVSFKQFSQRSGYVQNGAYLPFLGGELRISSDFAMDLAAGKKGIARLFDLIGHEMAHSEQNHMREQMAEIKEVDEKTRTLASKLLNDFGKQEISADRIHSMLSLMTNFLGDDYVKEFKQMDKKSQEERCREISFSQYIQFSHEIDARRNGLLYAYDMLSSLIEHPSCSGQMKKWLQEQAEGLKTLIDEEKQNNEKFKFFSDFRSHVEQLSRDTFAQLDDKIQEFYKLNIVKQWGKGKNLKKEESVYQYMKDVNQEMIKLSYKEKPFDVLSQDILFALYNGNEEFFAGLAETLKEREDDPQKAKKALGDAIVQMLLYDDLPRESFHIQFATILDDSQKLELLKGAIKTGRLDILHGFNKVLFNGSLDIKTAVFFKKTIIDLSEKHIKAFKEKDKFYSYEESNLYSIEWFVDNMIDYYRCKESDIALENLENSFNSNYKQKDLKMFDKDIEELSGVLKSLKEVESLTKEKITYTKEAREREREYHKKVYGERYNERHPKERLNEEDLSEEELFEWLFGDLDDPKEEKKEAPKEPLLLK